MGAAGICGGIGLLLLIIAGLLALRERANSTFMPQPIAEKRATLPSVSATVGDFVVDRERYVPAPGPSRLRYGSFEIRLDNHAEAVAQEMRGVVFSESHGMYFVTEVAAAARVPSDAPLRLKADGPISRDELEHLITAQYGRDGELLLDRLRLPGKSWVALIFQDENRQTFVVRRHFSLDGPDEQLRASGFEQPKIFAARDEDPVYYERHLRPVARTLADRVSNSWNSLRLRFVKAGPSGVKIGIAFAALILALLGIGLDKHRDRLESQLGWRSVSRFDQRVIADYLRPLAGQEVTIIAPSAHTDFEAHRFGSALQAILRNAGWRAELREAQGTVKAAFPQGLFFVTPDLEHPAVKPLHRALAKAGIDLRRAETYWPYGVPELWPPGDHLTYLALGLLVGRSPNEGER